MYDKPMLSLMADHNRWMNEKLYAVCAGIADEARKRDLGAFFRSIHGTLNHLLLVDRLWLGRINGKPFPIRSLDQELYADIDTLKRERADTDAVIAGFIAGLQPAHLAEPVTYISFVRQESVTLPLGLILTHLFHHQTHHRGQITTLISPLGYDYGETDLIYLPQRRRGTSPHRPVHGADAGRGAAGQGCGWHVFRSIDAHCSIRHAAARA
ncbi:DinB family protein [Methylococcus sp. Mc7]|uniref:DinB family protein n=1 Tax=Methylococcus sp. Mc7 TaxID=2860258 RepID=UPI001C52B955|nr:DinB family protein [Methylococcus sp. Mc7]QXP85847.1 DinB family protein [Methylococcus sp. Mc7]